MATADTNSVTGPDGNDDVERAASPRGMRFIAEVFDGAHEALAALEVVESDLVSTPFQTRDWLTALYEETAPVHRLLPRLVVVTERVSGEPVMALPLAVRKEGHLRVARLADLGTDHTCGPLLSRRALDDRQSRQAWRSARAALRDIDLIRFERMPAEIGGKRNPLIDLFGIAPSPATAHLLTVESEFEGYLQSLDKKYRKEIERSERLWKKEGQTRFYRAETMDEIAHVFATLEEQQAVWHAAHGMTDVFADQASRSFYERLAIDGADAGLTELYALQAGGRIAATVFGIVHENTFTLLLISTGGEEWSHLSPGRLVVLETVKHILPRGIRCFQLGINSNPLKHGYGTEGVPLFDLVVAQDVTALPKAIGHEIRAHWPLRSIFKKATPSAES